MFQRLAASIALGLALTGTAMAETDIRFTLGWKTQGSDAPMLLALSKGYFKQEGLNVTIDQGEGSGATVTRIMSGTYDAGFGDINAIIQNAATRPEETPVMVYQMWSVPPFAVSSRKETGIQTPADLVGKVLGGSQGTPTTRLIAVLARKNGIDPDQLQVTNMAPNLQEPMLIKGDIDGALVFTITGWFNLVNNRQDPEADYNWLNFGDFGLDLYSNGVMVSRRLIAENPDAVRGLVRAINRAAIEIGTDPAAGAEAIIAYDNLAKADLERDRMIFAYERLMQSDESARIGLGDLDDARLARSIDIVAEGYELPTKPEVAAVFTREFLPPLDDRKLVYTPQ
ncbi:ABC transporter substrate-binding protein [Paracoccus laeviglucosivorans]|uniref:Thiamine pyrimidine synthase n=1 Tax=Paracoccus laeviglucosivorans TaxID=1197861 RepID=A0A521E930_9RHOB|nr:ABC transporter substrate-binding protein [Paracoccus laeviglucosivorans]SMO80414.1 NitT/TauT family transport system substrate-binding protein [Paracoccus laeviglucosivorans]